MDLFNVKKANQNKYRDSKSKKVKHSNYNPSDPSKSTEKDGPQKQEKNRHRGDSQGENGSTRSPHHVGSGRIRIAEEDAEMLVNTYTIQRDPGASSSMNGFSQRNQAGKGKRERLRSFNDQQDSRFNSFEREATPKPQRNRSSGNDLQGNSGDKMSPYPGKSGVRTSESQKDDEPFDNMHPNQNSGAKNKKNRPRKAKGSNETGEKPYEGKKGFENSYQPKRQTGSESQGHWTPIKGSKQLGAEKQPPPQIPKNLKKETEEIAMLTQKYSKRRIESTWTRRYDLPKYDDEDDEGAEFGELSNSSSFSVASHFLMKEEQEWFKQAESCGTQFSLDLKCLAAGLACIPFYKRQNLLENMFGPKDLKSMVTEAESNVTIYRDVRGSGEEESPRLSLPASNEYFDQSEAGLIELRTDFLLERTGLNDLNTVQEDSLPSSTENNLEKYIKHSKGQEVSLPSSTEKNSEKYIKHSTGQEVSLPSSSEKNLEKSIKHSTGQEVSLPSSTEKNLEKDKKYSILKFDDDIDVFKSFDDEKDGKMTVKEKTPPILSKQETITPDCLNKEEKSLTPECITKTKKNSVERNTPELNANNVISVIETKEKAFKKSDHGWNVENPEATWDPEPTPGLGERKGVLDKEQEPQSSHLMTESVPYSDSKCNKETTSDIQPVSCSINVTSREQVVEKASDKKVSEEFSFRLAEKQEIGKELKDSNNQKSEENKTCDKKVFIEDDDLNFLLGLTESASTSQTHSAKLSRTQNTKDKEDKKPTEVSVSGAVHLKSPLKYTEENLDDWLDSVLEN